MKSKIMNAPLIYKKILVKKSPIQGYGVFAAQDFKKNEVIEECYAILANGDDVGLTNYYFSCKHAKDKSFLPLGNGCIYNHSKTPNADYNYDFDRKVFVYHALSEIKRGEEIFISYGDNWFGTRKIDILPNEKYTRKKIFLTLTRFGLVFGTIYAVVALLNMISVARVPM